MILSISQNFRERNLSLATFGSERVKETHEVPHHKKVEKLTRFQLAQCKDR